MKQKVIFILLSMVLFGCQSDSQQSKTGKLVEIDISGNHPLKELHIQTVANVEYVPLETTDDFLLGSNPMLSHISDNYILVWQSSGDIFIFNRDGKAISYFNHRGNGPKEYVRISNVLFDENNEEIFVNTNLSRILVYSPTGDYKRTLSLPDDIRNMTVCNFDDKTILVYDETGLQNNEYREDPYLFVSKQDGSIVSTLKFMLPVRYSNRMTSVSTDARGQQISQPVRISIPNNKHYGEDFMIADISSDTIYRLTKSRDLVPMLVRKPSVHSSDPKTVLTSLLTTDKFMFLWKISFDLNAFRNNQNLYTSLMYEMETGKTYEVSLINDDIPSWTWVIDVDNLAIDKNMTASLIDMFFLKNTHEEGKLNDKLEKLVETFDEEDNPVLMIVKFK